MRVHTVNRVFTTPAILQIARKFLDPGGVRGKRGLPAARTPIAIPRLGLIYNKITNSALRRLQLVEKPIKKNAYYQTSPTPPRSPIIFPSTALDDFIHVYT